MGKPWKHLDSGCWRKHTAVEAPQRAVGQVVLAQEAKLRIRPGRGILGERERGQSPPSPVALQGQVPPGFQQGWEGVEQPVVTVYHLSHMSQGCQKQMESVLMPCFCLSQLIRSPVAACSQYMTSLQRVCLFFDQAFECILPVAL